MSPAASRFPLLAGAGLIAVIAVLATRGAPSEKVAPVVESLDTAKGVPKALTSLPSVDSTAGNPRPGDPLKGEFLFLFDVSTSTHTRASDDPYHTALAKLRPAVDALREVDLLMPQRIRVGTIGAASLMQRPRCDFVAETPTTFKQSDTTLIPRRLLGCLEAMRSLPPEAGTDIRGALHYAGLTLRGARSMTRGVLIASDLEEAMPRGRVPATPDLSGICVLTVSMMTPEFETNPDSLSRLETVWKARIQGWGAKKVEVRSVIGFDAEDAAQFFQSCRSAS